MRHLIAVISALALLSVTAIAQQKRDDSQPGQTSTLKVSGMFCGACAKAVEKAAKKVDGVRAVTANQPKGVAEIRYDPAKTSPAAIAKAITQKTPFKAEVQSNK
jgi:copper chaperone CopZ